MRYIMMAMIMVLISLDLSKAQAADLAERESLRGLPGVTVTIEKLGPDAQADGLSQETIQTAVELMLRSNGIRVLTQSEMFNTPSAPFLYLRIAAIKNGPVYGLCVNIQLNQQVSLVHRPKHSMIASTWENAQVAMVGKGNLRDVISGIIEPLVKAFANDFLAVNPR